MLLHNKKGPWGPHDAFASDKRDRSRCCLTLRQFRFHRLLGWMDAAQIPSICTPPPIFRTRQSRTGSHWPGPIGDYSSQRNDYLLSNQQRRRSSFFNHTTYAIGSPLLTARLPLALRRTYLDVFFCISPPMPELYTDNQRKVLISAQLTNGCEKRATLPKPYYIHILVRLP